jgi:hypothetical protein
MSKGTYPLKLPASIKRAAERLAKEDGVSLNQWISVAVAQKISAVEIAANYRQGRGPEGDPRSRTGRASNAGGRDRFLITCPRQSNEPASICDTDVGEVGNHVPSYRMCAVGPSPDIG